jgi:hypothetical protein
MYFLNINVSFRLPGGLSEILRAWHGRFSFEIRKYQSLAVWPLELQLFALAAQLRA